MGQGVSLQKIPEPHVRMYQNLVAMQSPKQKAQMIQTILSSPDHLNSAREAGVYGHLLHYVQVANTGSQPPPLPSLGGTQPQQQPQQPQQPQKAQQIQATGKAPQATSIVSKGEKGTEKALNYFSACLRILNLEEEVALTEEALKGAYKKAVLWAHPDKGGSEKEYEAVTRAFAYLGEILHRIHGGRAQEGKMEAPTAIQGTRAQEADKWKHAEPVSLNPKNLDMNTFNKLFEQTRIPDPEEDGYGDWLKGGGDDSGPKFSGKFNDAVMNQYFQEVATKKGIKEQNSLVVQEMSLASRLGYATELGRGGREDYTVTPHEGKMAYTDLKKAYTDYNTISQNTVNVNINARSFEQVQGERKSGPPPLTDHELEALRAAETAAFRAEEQRKLRQAQQSIEENDYFERMKRLVIRN